MALQVLYKITVAFENVVKRDYLYLNVTRQQH